MSRSSKLFSAGFFFLFSYGYLFVFHCLYMCVDICATHACGGQRTSLWSQFSPFKFVWDLGIEFRSLGLHDKHTYLPSRHDKHIYLPSHLADPLLVFETGLLNRLG